MQNPPPGYAAPDAYAAQAHGAQQQYQDYQHQQYYMQQGYQQPAQPPQQPHAMQPAFPPHPSAQPPAYAPQPPAPPPAYAPAQSPAQPPPPYQAPPPSYPGAPASSQWQQQQQYTPNMAQSGVYPVAMPPADPELLTTINKTSGYCARNGQAFENMIREREGPNPKFAFLQHGGDGNEYFRWRVHCMAMGLDQAAMDAIQNEAFPRPSVEDEAELMRLLETLSGSKDNIRSLRSWIMAHEKCMDWVCETLRLRCESALDFAARLHVLYVINDVLHACLKRRDAAPTPPPGPDPSILKISHHVARILPLVFQAAGEVGDQQAKVTKVVGLWKERKIFEAQEIENLMDALLSPNPSLIPPPTVDMAGLASYRVALTQLQAPPPAPPPPPHAPPVPPGHEHAPSQPPPPYGAGGMDYTMQHPHPHPAGPPPPPYGAPPHPMMAGAPPGGVKPLWASPDEMPAGLIVYVANLMRMGGSPAYTPIPPQICPPNAPPMTPVTPQLQQSIEKFYSEGLVERLKRQQREKKEQEEAEAAKAKAAEEEAAAREAKAAATEAAAAAAGGAAPTVAGAARSGVNWCTPRKTVPKVSNQFVGVSKLKAKKEEEDDDDVADVFKV